MKERWYEIYGTATGSTAQGDESLLLAKVRSEGVARIVADSLSIHYSKVKVVYDLRAKS